MDKIRKTDKEHAAALNGLATALNWMTMIEGQVTIPRNKALEIGSILIEAASALRGKKP